MRLLPAVARILPATRQRQAQGRSLRFRRGHTGQHCDTRRSDDFFIQSGIPMPSVNVESGSDTQARQTGSSMAALQDEILCR
jgi:UDP-N-acetylglucosamine 2-epimerase